MIIHFFDLFWRKIHFFWKKKSTFSTIFGWKNILFSTLFWVKKSSIFDPFLIKIHYFRSFLGEKISFIDPFLMIVYFFDLFLEKNPLFLIKNKSSFVDVFSRIHLLFLMKKNTLFRPFFGEKNLLYQPLFNDYPLFRPFLDKNPLLLIKKSTFSTFFRENIYFFW